VVAEGVNLVLAILAVGAVVGLKNGQAELTLEEDGVEGTRKAGFGVTPGHGVQSDAGEG
jgi:hypothetical protein